MHLLCSLANHAALLLPENTNAVSDVMVKALKYITERQNNEENIQTKYESPYNCGKMIVSIYWYL